MFTIIAYLCVYASAILFITGMLVKVARYMKHPMHLRWELYPVAHERNKAEYGGSYLEETDWVKKPRCKSRMGELRVMIPEIFFLKAVHESNRSLWSASYPFHLGLYITAAFIAALFASAGMEVAGFPTAVSGKAWTFLLNCLGLCGFILVITGGLGLICRRIADDDLRDSTSSAHYVRVGWFVTASGSALGAWFMDGYSFGGFRGFTVSLVQFNIGQRLNPHIVAPVILGAALVALIPWTHMAHFFMKYFLYHDIRWGDAPMTGSRSAEANLQEVLNYRPTWAADHVQANGQKTWADLAAHNPAREKKE